MDYGKVLTYNSIGLRQLLVSALFQLCILWANGQENTQKSLCSTYCSDSVHCVGKLAAGEVNNEIVLPFGTNFKSKQNALEIIEKVVQNKNRYSETNPPYCNYDVYDKLMFAWNNFNPKTRIFKRWPTISQFADTSVISGRSVLPIAMYESFSTHYFRKETKTDNQVVHGRLIYGLTDDLNAEDACENLVRDFDRIDVRSNNIRVFFNKIASPLSSSKAISLYHWAIVDTAVIDQKKYIRLCFRPSSIADLGFIGNIYVSTDGKFAIKRAIMKISKNMNLNYVEEFVSYQNFDEVAPEVWIPSRTSLTIKISAFGILKNYIEYGRSYNNYQFVQKSDSVYEAKRIVYDKGYLTRDLSFWKEHRDIKSMKNNHDFCTDTIVNTIIKIPFINFSIKTTNLIVDNYIPLWGNTNTSKVSLGTFDTFYNGNSIEGSRFRLSLITSSALFPHLFFSGYVAYGTKDQEFKYSASTTWAFNKPNRYSEEFPRNNLTLTNEYDLNTLGENYFYVKRDNIFLSLLRYRKLQLRTYAHRSQLSYIKEYRNGFSFNVLVKSQDEKPAGDLKFLSIDPLSGNQVAVNNLKTTELTTIFRYASNERFFVRSNSRIAFPGERSVISLTHTLGITDFLEGNYHYNKLQLHLIKDIWLASFGQLNTSVKLEKVWGTVPYPLLISPNANNSYTIQNESFSLISPLEFINDKQLSWNSNYYCKGWLLKKIPLIKRLHLREIMGLSGFIGSLSSRNLPENNPSLFVFPENAHRMGNYPYLEMNVGLSNIFNVLRVDYIRRLNYLNTPHIKKQGFRVSVRLHF